MRELRLNAVPDDSHLVHFRPMSNGSSTRPVLRLAYHQVLPADATYLYQATCRQLDSHLRYIASEIERGSAPQITFDDGHESCFIHALPLLQQHARRAIFFVVTSWTGTKRGYMRPAELRELCGLDHEVQSHSLSHAMLTQCSDEELRAELFDSKQKLEDILGREVDAISIPYGRWNLRIMKAIGHAGYRRVYTSDRTYQVGYRGGIKVFGRIMVTRTTSVGHLQRWSQPSRMDMALAKLERIGKRSVRFAVGESFYHWLWCRLAHFEQDEKL
jgi:peptidoglycan/xylan/chitin deacetylase (PgdA/CDA1 family)